MSRAENEKEAMRRSRIFGHDLPWETREGWLARHPRYLCIHRYGALYSCSTGEVTRPATAEITLFADDTRKKMIGRVCAFDLDLEEATRRAEWMAVACGFDSAVEKMLKAVAHRDATTDGSKGKKSTRRETRSEEDNLR